MSQLADSQYARMLYSCRESEIREGIVATIERWKKRIGKKYGKSYWDTGRKNGGEFPLSRESFVSFIDSVEPRL